MKFIIPNVMEMLADMSQKKTTTTAKKPEPVKTVGTTTTKPQAVTPAQPKQTKPKQTKAVGAEKPPAGFPMYPPGGGSSTPALRYKSIDNKVHRIVTDKYMAELPYSIKGRPIENLCKILNIKRKHKTPSEEAFVKNWLEPLPNAWSDACGNVHVKVPYAAKNIKNKLVLFSSHTDTVHRTAGNQKLSLDANTGYVMRTNDKPDNDVANRHGNYYQNWGSQECLGADDGVGVWLMMQMITRKVPGYYVFHRGEECGGVGSSYIKENFKSVFSDMIETYGKTPFDFCIAFDRKGTNEIIHTQGGTRCASDTASKQLAKALNDNGHNYELSDRGSFTDSANYKYLIPECFNIGVGYYKQHGPQETQDLPFAEALLSSLCKVTWTALSPSRDHTTAAARATSNSRQSYRAGGTIYSGGVAGWKPSDVNGSEYDDAFFDDMENADIPNAGDEPASVNVLIELISKHPLIALQIIDDFQLSNHDILLYLENLMPDDSLYQKLLAKVKGGKPKTKGAKAS